MDILTKLAAPFRTRAIQREQTFEELAQAVFNEELTDVDEIARQIEILGHTPQELQQAVDRLEEIARLQAEIKQEQSLRGEIIERQQVMDAKRHALEVATREANSASELHMPAINAAGSKLNAIAQARLRLQQLVAGTVRDAIDLAAADLATLRRRRDEIRGQNDPYHSRTHSGTGQLNILGRLLQTRAELAKCRARDATPQERALIPRLEADERAILAEKAAFEKELVDIEKQIAKAEQRHAAVVAEAISA